MTSANSYPGQTDTNELREAIRRELPEIVFAGWDDPDEWRLHTAADVVPEAMFGTPRLRALGGAIVDLMQRYRALFGLGSGFAMSQVRSLPMLAIAGMSRAGDVVDIMCNPTLSRPVGRAVFPENCASTPHVAAVVEAPWAADLGFWTPEGLRVDRKVEGRDARVADHEVRHLMAFFVLILQWVPTRCQAVGTKLWLLGPLCVWTKCLGWQG